MASGTADLQRDLGGAIMQSILGALLTAGYASAVNAAIAGSPEAAQVTDQVQSELTKSFASASDTAQQYPQYSDQIIAAAKQSFVDGQDWAYLAGIVAVLLGFALVYFFFPKADRERELLAGYAAEDAVGRRSPHGLASTASTLDAATSERRPRAVEGTSESSSDGSAGLVGVAGVAIAQPVLDSFGKSPETFVFRDAEGLDLVLFGLAVVLVPPLVVWWIGVVVGCTAPLADGSSTARRSGPSSVWPPCRCCPAWSGRSPSRSRLRRRSGRGSSPSARAPSGSGASSWSCSRCSRWWCSCSPLRRATSSRARTSPPRPAAARPPRWC